MLIYGRAKNLAISPSKMGLLMDLIRGRDIVKAEELLANSNKKGARLALKVLKASLANAAVAQTEVSRVVEARADKAPTLKRMRPRARGQSNRILKRRTNLTIGLESVGDKKGQA